MLGTQVWLTLVRDNGNDSKNWQLHTESNIHRNGTLDWIGTPNWAKQTSAKLSQYWTQVLSNDEAPWMHKAYVYNSAQRKGKNWEEVATIKTHKTVT